MSFRMRGGALPLILPANPTVCFLGDSITDVAPWNAGAPPTQPAYGQWASTLQNRFLWQRLNANMIRNGDFENGDPATGNVNGGAPLNWTASGCTITCDTTRAKYGSQSLKIVPTSSGANFLYPESNDYGGSVLQDGLQAGQTYTFSAWFYIAATQHGTLAVQALWNSGGLHTTTSANMTTVGAWTQATICFTIPANATDASLRITWNTTTLADVAWVDGVQLEPVPTIGAPYGATPFCRWSSRGAIASSLLSNFGATASNLQDNLGARTNVFVGGTTIANLYIMQEGMNDLTHTDTAGSAPTSLTLAAYKTSMSTVLSYLLGLNGTCQVLVGGISNSYQTITTRPAWWSSLDDAATQMDDATRQVIAGLGASASRVRFVKTRPWPYGPANVDFAGAKVHPTSAVGGGMDQLAARYIAALEMGA